MIKTLSRGFLKKDVEFRIPTQIYSLNDKYSLVKYESEAKKEKDMSMQIDNEYFAFYLFYNGIFNNKVYLDTIKEDIEIVGDNRIISIKKNQNSTILKLYKVEVITK